MARTLEDLLNDLIALDKANPRVRKPENPSVAHVQVRHSPAAIGSDIPQGCELPADVMAELDLPSSLAGIFKSLQDFHGYNRHKPFTRTAADTAVYVENDLMLSLVRVYIGSHSTLQVRGNGTSMTFKIDAVYEYQQQLHDGSIAVVFRSPEDFLSSPDRAQGKPVETLLFFSVFLDGKSGVSTFSIKPEYVRSAGYGSMRSRRMA